MRLQTVNELRRAVVLAAESIPTPPPVIFSDSTTARPEAGAFIVAAIRDGRAAEIATGCVQEVASLEIGVFAPRGGDAELREIADAIQAAIEAAEITGATIFPASRALQIGDTASTLAVVLDFPVITYR